MSRGPEAKSSRVLPKLLISLALGALFAWVAERGGVPIVPSGSSFRQVDRGEVDHAVPHAVRLAPGVVGDRDGEGQGLDREGPVVGVLGDRIAQLPDGADHRADPD